MITLNDVEPLILDVSEKQRADKLSDADVARRLGITRSYWTQLRNGTRTEVSARVLRGIMRAFPDLTTKALLFLSTEVTQRTSEGE